MIATIDLLFGNVVIRFLRFQNVLRWYNTILDVFGCHIRHHHIVHRIIEETIDVVRSLRNRIPQCKCALFKSSIITLAFTWNSALWFLWLNHLLIGGSHSGSFKDTWGPLKRAFVVIGICKSQSRTRSNLCLKEVLILLLE